MKGFVPDYKDELCKHDIQLSPISLGTGTKGKVLDAFVNGLLVIGTFRAIENIQVENDKDFIYYDNPNILIDYLYDIPKNINKYEEMAKLGRDTVLRKHEARKIAEDFFKLFK